jgi:hypothetical protein
MTESPEAYLRPLLDRREAIRRVSGWLGGAALVGGCGLIANVERAHASAATRTGERIGEFDEAQIALLDEIAETLLPATHTPGAKEAKTGSFMALMVTDAYGPTERQVFLDGMRGMDTAMRKAHRVSFMEATPTQRLELLTVLDIDQKRVMDARDVADRGHASMGDGPAIPYFRMMKELAMLGFFTSEVGCTRVLRYIETPGRYEPCTLYATGEPAWALHA